MGKGRKNIRQDDTLDYPYSMKFPKELIGKIREEGILEERSIPQQIRFILKKHYENKNENTHNKTNK